MKPPLVSIAFPVFNGEAFMKRALDSLVQQNYSNIEINIVENCSTDETLTICKEYESKFQFVHLYINEEKLNQTRNYEKALLQGKGKYLMLTAADDFWKPSFVETLVNELEQHPESGVAFCAIHRVNEYEENYDELHFLGKNNPNNKGYLTTLRKTLTPDIKYNLYFYGLFRSQILKNAMKYYPHDVAGHDRLFIVQMALITHFRYVDKLLYVRTQNIVGFDKRYPDEQFTLKLSQRFKIARTASNLVKMIVNSGAIPENRKLLLPLVVAIFLIETNWYTIRSAPLRYYWKTLRLMKTYLPEEVYNKLRKLKQILQ